MSYCSNLVFSPYKNYNFVARVVVEKVPVFNKKANKICRF
jgi:hypothetical protein